jgi:hypothetical protein
MLSIYYGIPDPEHLAILFTRKVLPTPVFPVKGDIFLFKSLISFLHPATFFGIDKGVTPVFHPLISE